MFKYRIVFSIFMTGFLAGAAGASSIEVAGVEKSQLKSAFIYQFTNFINWPAEGASSREGRPFVISVIGDPEIEDALKGLAAQKKVKNRNIEVKSAETLSEVENSDIVLIGRGDSQEVKRLLAGLRGHKMLLITEQAGSIKDGSMINFFMEDGRLRFEMSRPLCERAGFQVNSRLLNLARLVNE